MPSLFELSSTGSIIRSGSPLNRSILHSGNISAAALRRRQEKLQLQQFLPDETEVLQEVERQNQEEESSFLQDLLEFPSKVAGFFAITGGIEGLLEDGIEGGLEGFARGTPFAFLSDALGITDDLAQRKSFRDIRIAAGDSDVDEGIGNTVLNILGDIALDPTTWIMPFGTVAKANRFAASILHPARRLHRGDIAKKIATGSVDEITEDAAIAITKQNELIESAIKEGRLVPHGRMDLITPKTAEEVLGREEALAELVPGLVFDQQRGVARQASTYAEKVESGISALFMFKVPFSDEGTLLRILPRGIELKTAKALTATARGMREVPLVGDLIRRFDATQVRGLGAVERNVLREGQRADQQVLNAVITEGASEVKRLQRTDIAQHLGRDEQQTIIDLLEFNATDLDEIGVREVMGQANALQRQQARVKAATSDPEVAEMFARRSNDDLEGLYEREIPLNDSELARIGKQARPGVELPASPRLLADETREAARRIGADPDDILPETEARLTAERGRMREEAIELARQSRVERLDSITKRVADGTYTFKDLQQYAKGLRGILDNLRAKESAAEVLDSSLELYFPRIMSDGARNLLNATIETRIRSLGDKAWGIAAPFLEHRKFTNLSTTEVNTLLGVLGSKVTGFTSLETLNELVRGDKSWYRKLMKEAPDVAEFFSTDVTGAVYNRIEQSGKVLGKKAMLDIMFDDTMGIVRHVTQSRDLADTLRTGRLADGTDIGLHVPFVRQEGRGSVSMPEFATIVAEGASAGLRARAGTANRLLASETAGRLKATRGDYKTRIDELQAARDLKMSDDVAPNATDLVTLQSKKATVRSVRTHEAQRNWLRGLVPTGRKPQGVEKRLRARVTRVKGGETVVDFQNLDAAPDDLKRWSRRFRDSADDIARDTTLTGPQKRKRLETLSRNFNKEVDQEIRLQIKQADTLVKEGREELSRIDGRLASEIGRLREEGGIAKRALTAGQRQGREAIQNNIRDISGEQLQREINVFEAQGWEWGFKAYDDPQMLAEALADQPSRAIHWIDRDTASAVTDFMQAYHKPDTWRATFQITDRITNLWKRLTVLPFPQSRFRDRVSNVSLLVMGGFRHPSAYSDAVRMQSAYSKYIKGEVENIDAVLDGITINLGQGRSMKASEAFMGARQRGILDGGYLRDEFQDTVIDIHEGISRKPSQLRAAFDPIMALDLRTLAGGKSESFWVKKGMAITEWGDNQDKLAGYIDGLKRGMTADEAAQHVKKFLWSPGSTNLTSTEKHLFRRAIPFYNWMRFSTGLMVDQYLKNPKAFGVFAKTRENFEAMAGTQDVPEDLLAGRNIAERLGIPLEMGPEGPRYLIFDGYLPHADVPAVTRALMGIIPGSGVSAQESLSFIGERLNPIVKEPLEAAINFNFYTQRDVEFFEGEHAEIFGVPVSKKTRKFTNNLRFLKAVDDLNILNLKDMRIAMGDAVERTGPEQRDQLPGLSRAISGPLGITPRIRNLDLEREVRRGAARARFDANKLKAGIRKRLEDKRPARQADMETLRDLLTRKQAEILRLDQEAKRRNIDLRR